MVARPRSATVRGHDASSGEGLSRPITALLLIAGWAALLDIHVWRYCLKNDTRNYR